jgi:hypothetical protein
MQINDNLRGVASYLLALWVECVVGDKDGEEYFRSESRLEMHSKNRCRRLTGEAQI